VALPILKRHNAPFLMYVPTGGPTRTLQAWWIGLRELIAHMISAHYLFLGTIAFPVRLR